MLKKKTVLEKSGDTVPVVGKAADLLLPLQLQHEQQGQAGGQQLRVQEDEEWSSQHPGEDIYK